MRSTLSLVTLLAIAAAGCSSRFSGSGTSTVSPPPIEIAAKSGLAPLLITESGTYGSPTEPLIVRIREDGTLYVSRNRKSGQTTVSPGWQVRPGWFAYIENEERVWAFDGEREFALIEVKPGIITTYGPRRFPCPIPPEVESRLPDSTKHAIVSYAMPVQ